ncbi:alcohol dehydrogenase catalytic domain-containing protein [Metallumcola ferriviriculae]|uniref:Alcohol dehydrogenase catalytic domain-containing protein n=1 Tax=Metallumcola ferriviriculae TaxID=3039180 RepID=A0AAU0UQM9_9FIRM|nr:alcohol dehydrogenase catalytic domain-containing protein [Desulfitibacteraceae bacterium MK1]
MKAVRKIARAPGEMQVADVPQPDLQPGQLLIKVGACAVCGSDLHAYNYDPGYEFIKVPVTLGHEFSGTIVEVGPGATEWQQGQQVLVEATHYCGSCPQCHLGRTNTCENFQVLGLHKNGGMAQYVAADVRYVHPLEPGLDLIQGAIVEPASVALHGVVDNSNISPGDVVLVSGPGVIGILAAQAARIMGAGMVVISGTSADEKVRLTLARQMGFETINVANETLIDGLFRLTGRNEADVVIECSGNALALEDCLAIPRKGGALTIIGLYPGPSQIFITPVVRKEIIIRTSYSSKWVNYRQAMNLIASGRLEVNPLITKYPLQKALDGFNAALEKKIVKAVLVP